MKYVENLKLFYQKYLYKTITIVIVGIGVFLVLIAKIIVTIIQQLPILIQDIIDPDINYDSIEDSIE